MQQRGKIRLVVAGGGNGGPRVARGLLKYPDVHLDSISNMIDEGGSSKVIRQLGAQPPGDYRRYAEAHLQGRHKETWVKILTYRFPTHTMKTGVGFQGSHLLQLICRRVWEGEGEKRFEELYKSGGDTIRSICLYVFPYDFSLGGHTGGNLLFFLCEELWGRQKGHRRFNQLLNIHGGVWPVTIEDARLVAEFYDKTELVGEDTIDQRSVHDLRPIKRVRLEPVPHAYWPVREAIDRAHGFIWPAGDTHTSIYPIRCTEGIISSLKKSEAWVGYVVNLMTKPAETRYWRASRFVRNMFRYGREREAFDTVFVNVGEIPRDIRRRYAKEEHAHPVIFDEREAERMSQFAKHVVTGNYLSEADLARGRVRHDPDAIAHDIMCSVLRHRGKRLTWIVDLDDTIVVVPRNGDSVVSLPYSRYVAGAREFIHAHGDDIVVLSAGDQKLQRMKVKFHNIDDFVADVVIVDTPEHKAEKISAIIREKKLDPSSVVVVGDRLDTEIRVGNNLGCITVRVRYPGTKRAHEEPTTRDEIPTYTVADFHELERLPFFMREAA